MSNRVEAHRRSDAPRCEALGALPPNLFAVVDVKRRKVLVRGMQRCAARGYAAGWKRLGGSPRIVADEAVFPPPEELLKLADV